MKKKKNNIKTFGGFTELELKKPYGLFTMKPTAEGNEVAVTGEWTRVQIERSLTIDLAEALDNDNWSAIINYAAAKRFKEVC